MTTGNPTVRNSFHPPSNRISPLGRLGSWCFSHRKLVVLAWIGALVVFSVLGRLAGAQFKDDLSAGTPIATAVVAVASTFGLLDLLSHALTVPSFGPELAALVGLGVGIDYAAASRTPVSHSSMSAAEFGPQDLL
jgi:uncharacterized membrane protein YdfJ with MMPL/SSD domain